VFYESQRPTYEDLLQQQIEMAKGKYGVGDLDKLLAGSETWTIN